MCYVTVWQQDKLKYNNNLKRKRAMGSMSDLASIEIFNAQMKLNEKNKYWGIELTKVEEMQWDKWKSDRNNCPSLNTIPHIKRVELLINFLKSIR